MRRALSSGCRAAAAPARGARAGPWTAHGPTARRPWQVERSGCADVTPRWCSDGPAAVPQLSRREQDRLKAEAFVVERGYSQEVAAGVVAALSAPGSGVPPGGLFDVVKMMAGRPEIGEDSGLEPLARSVELDMARQSGRKVVRFTVVPPGGGAPVACEGLDGMSLKEVAEHGAGRGETALSEFIECACSGVMACSTCQVYVHPDWLGKFGEPSDAELDMLELAHEPRETSRLGCQLRLTPEMDGLQVEIPGGANNIFDDEESHKVSGGRF